MILRSLAAGLVLLGATPVLAQHTLRLGVPDYGVFERGDATSAGRFYECYRLEVRAGQRVVIDLGGEQDNLLELVQGDSCGGTASLTDDDSGGNGDARLTFEAGSGPYLVRALLYRANEMGAYSISAKLETAATSIRAGQQVIGRWEDGDIYMDGGHADCFAFDGVGGQAVLARMEAGYLNSGIVLHRGGTCSKYGEVAKTEAVVIGPAALQALLPANDRYSFSVRGASDGAYQFGFINSAPPASAGVQVRLSGGDMIVGRLETGDRATSEGALFDCFVLDHFANRTVKVNLTSQGFGPRASIHRGSTCDGDLVNVAMQPEAGTISVSYRMPDDGAYSVRIGSGPTGGAYRVLAMVD